MYGLQQNFVYAKNVWMRSSQVAGAHDYQSQGSNSPRFNQSILKHSGVWVAADEAVLNIQYIKNPSQNGRKKFL
jgi:hypothetical protein